MRTFPTWQVWILQFFLPRKFWYRKFYLYSVHWKSLRHKKLMKSHYCCKNCGIMGWLDIHHLNYERLFRERMSDLQVLCRSCHELEHKK